MLSIHDLKDNSGDLQFGLYANIANLIVAIGDETRVLDGFQEDNFYLPHDFKFFLRDDVVAWLDLPEHHYIRDRFALQLNKAVTRYNSNLSLVRKGDHRHVYKRCLREYGHIQIYMNREHALLFKLEFL